MTRRGDEEGPHDDFASIFGSEGRSSKGKTLAPPPPRRIPRTATKRPAKPTPGNDFRWPDAGEPRMAAAPGVRDADLRALRRGNPEPEERIDLHGLRREAAGPTLGRRIEAARRRGLRCVAVVHGRGLRSGDGQAVLREALVDWLTAPPCRAHVLAFAPAPRRHGDDGATLVLLRPPDDSDR